MNIAFILLDNMLGTSISWPTEMLHAAMQFNRKQALNIETLSLNDKAIKTQSGIHFVADKTLILTLEKYDYIFIPALWRNPRKVIKQSLPLIEWLKQQHTNGSHITAVGTGCCILAETGLLDGKPATTHWYFFDEFSKMYPNIDLKRQHFITEADKLYCAASINSLADLIIHHIHSMFDRKTALHIEKHFSHEIRQSYDNRGYFEYQDNKHSDELISQAQYWLQENFADEINLKHLSEKYELSERHFSRRFKEATGKTPAVYLQSIRLHTAKDLLQASNLSIQDIAYRVGFTDTSYFSALFKKHLSSTPKEYRKTVRAKLFSH